MSSDESPRIGSGLTLGVFAQIKNDILNGRYEANETVPVELICEELGVSRSPIMAALRILAERGLVVIQPQVGCRVASFSQSEARDFFSIFAIMESAIAELAAERRNEEQLREMSETIDQLARARTTRDQPAAREGNRRFHAIMHEMSGTQLIAEQSNRMWDLRDFIVRTSSIPELRSMERHLDHEHHAILTALRKRNGARAKELTERHILGVLKYLENTDVEKNGTHRAG